MRKKLLLLTTLLAITLGLRAENADGILSIANVQFTIPGYAAGGSFDVVLNENNTTVWAGAQFKLTLPAGFTYTGYTKGALTSNYEDFTYSVTEVGTRTYSVLIYRSTSTNFSAQTGSLITFNFTVDGGTALGTYEIPFFDAAVTNIGGTEFGIAAFNENISVNKIVNLDESKAWDSDLAITGIDAHVIRHFNANTWSTVVHPFAMTAEQVTEVFGAGTKIGYFEGYDTDANNDITKINFDERTSMEANTPYIIKVPTAINDYTVEGVDLVAFEGNTCFDAVNGNVNRPVTDYDGPALCNGTWYKASKTVFYYTSPKDMIGTYSPITIEDDCLFLLNNKFMFSNGSSRLKSFHAYFKFEDATYYPSPSRQFIINFGDNIEATGIVSQKKVATDDNVYSLTGQQVKNPTKGIFIKNGKKVIMK